MVRYVEEFSLKITFIHELFVNLAHFSCSSAVKEEYFIADFTQFLSTSNIVSLSEEFHSRFENFHKLKSLLTLYNNPMQVNAATQSSKIQFVGFVM